MRILLTGATGFIGSHLARRLGARHDIAALLRPESRRLRLSGIEPPLRELIWDGDVASLPALLAEFGPEAIIHLASYYTGVHQPEDIDPLIASNLRFPTALLDAAAAIGCGQFINTGSVMQHYEDAEYSPFNLYAATKQAFADILTYYVRAGGLARAITLQLTDTYGPNDPRSKLIPLLRAAAAKSEVLAMSPGEQLVDLVHVTDVAAGFEHALTLLPGVPARQQRIYALRSATPMKLRDFVALYNEVSADPVRVEWGARSYRPSEMMQPWTQGEDLPGWRPTIDLREGLRELLATPS